MASKKLIDGLNQQLNREVTTFLRYMLQATSIKGAQYEGVRRMYQEEVQDEVGHAMYLAEQIVQLGGTPVLDPDLTPPPADVRKMLENDAKAEATDVKHYVRMATMSDKEGLYGLKMKMEQQAADEDEHRWEMTRLLG